MFRTNPRCASNSDEFRRIREKIARVIGDPLKRTEALSRLDALEAAPDKTSIIERYTQVVGVISDHITVLSFLLTPLFQKLRR